VTAPPAGWSHTPVYVLKTLEQPWCNAGKTEPWRHYDILALPDCRRGYRPIGQPVVQSKDIVEGVKEVKSNE
jgi:hypothetical protein